MRHIILFIVLTSFSCFSQDGLFSEHKNQLSYPFKSISQQHDSAYYLMQNFYFACRENDSEKSSNIKQVINEKFQSKSWIVDNGVWDYNHAYYYRLNGDLDKAILLYNQSKQYFIANNYTTPILWAELGIANCDYYLNRRNVALEKYEGLYEKKILWSKVFD